MEYCKADNIDVRSWTSLNTPSRVRAIRSLQEIDEFDEKLVQNEERLQQLHKNQKILEQQYNDLCEQRDVLVELSAFLEDVSITNFTN